MTAPQDDTSGRKHAQKARAKALKAAARAKFYDQIAWFRAGSALNLIKKQSAAES